jgi:glucose/arabinose dehydrogenase
MRGWIGCVALLVVAAGGANGSAAETLTGEAAFSDWSGDAPGVRRLIRPQDMPSPGNQMSGSMAQMAPFKPDMKPAVPAGFEVSLFASGLDNPRAIRIAPNGDIFVAESQGNRIHIFRAAPGSATPSAEGIFADGLSYPYGIAFYPPGPEPQWVYVGQSGSVVRFPYRNGDMKAGGPPERIVGGVPTGGHGTRDIVFSADGKVLYVAVGSRSNAGEGMARRKPEDVVQLEAALGLGAAWEGEEGRAAVVAFEPDGSKGRVFATGIRNCSGITLHKATGEIWCATNERDGLGDNVPADYVTRVRAGKFYGWPWYYIGNHVDPRHAGARPDLADKVTLPDVLLQAHSAPLGIVFYDGDAFPPEYRGDGFATMHGSWNRGKRTGYKVVRIVMKDGAPTGEYEDFLTGFVLSENAIWGRPVGIAVTKDGALLVSEDGNDTIWRISAKK